MDDSIMEFIGYLFDLLFAAFGIICLLRSVSMAYQFLSVFQKLCGGQI